jgi:mannose-6-phosphate isomerase-like protein (cupin superfamily)
MSFLRKSLLLLPFFAVASSLPAQSPQSTPSAAPPSSTTHSAAELTQLEARLKAQAEKAPNGDATQTIEDQGTNWIVLVYRAHTGEAELHKDWSDEILVRSGTMTVVYGGTMSPQHPFGSRLGEFQSDSITGGTTQVLHAGDLLHIPAGVPHWVKIAPGESASYLVFKEM